MQQALEYKRIDGLRESIDVGAHPVLFDETLLDNVSRVKVEEILSRLNLSPTVLDLEGDGLAAVREVNPCLIIVGWDVRRATFVENLKSDPALFNIPVLVLDEKPTLETLSEMIEIGAEDCLRGDLPLMLWERRIRAAIRGKLLYDTVIQGLNEMALRDSLTGLWNHGHFHDLLGIECSRSDRKDVPLCLLMVDIDHFKRLNDRYGHPGGDKVIRKVASILRSLLRSGDLLARYGGEEFALILPETSRREGISIAARLQRNLAASPIGIGNVEIPVTVSAGLAMYPEDGTTGEEIVKSADIALYQAKRLGRNRVESVIRHTFAFVTDRTFEEVHIGGDFNGWVADSHPMKLVEQGEKYYRWEAAVVVPTGKFHYKFRARILDRAGKKVDFWMLDPDNPLYEPDEYGRNNSYVHIPYPAPSEE